MFYQAHVGGSSFGSYYRGSGRLRGLDQPNEHGVGRPAAEIPRPMPASGMARNAGDIILVMFHIYLVNFLSLMKGLFRLPTK